MFFLLIFYYFCFRHRLYNFSSDSFQAKYHYYQVSLRLILYNPVQAHGMGILSSKPCADENGPKDGILSTTDCWGVAYFADYHGHHRYYIHVKNFKAIDQVDVVEIWLAKFDLNWLTNMWSWIKACRNGREFVEWNALFKYISFKSFRF